jgi:hypothetical protein
VARLAGLSQVGIEQELRARCIPIHRPTPQGLKADLDGLGRIGI